MEMITESEKAMVAFEARSSAPSGTGYMTGVLPVITDVSENTALRVIFNLLSDGIPTIRYRRALEITMDRFHIQSQIPLPFSTEQVCHKTKPSFRRTLADRSNSFSCPAELTQLPEHAQHTCHHNGLGCCVHIGRKEENALAVWQRQRDTFPDMVVYRKDIIF